MAKYFFDCQTYDLLTADEEGVELPNVEAAHAEALNFMANVVREVVAQGKLDQRFAVQVRDEFGPVLEITAAMGSRILRKQ
jgi:hypothetical protein